jgi:hypothetical protein
MSEQSFEEQVRPGTQQGVRTPEEVHARLVTDPATPAAQVEALEEAGPQPVKSVAVPLGNGVVISVPLMTEWRASALEYMQAGQFDSWAESVLTEKDLGSWDEWMDTDPKLGELQEFMAAVGKATGGAAGNRASRRQLQRTLRR